VNEAPLTFGIIQGGKADPIEPKLQGGGPPGHDWLRDLAYGDRFLAKRHFHSGPDIPSFGIAMVIPEAILLADFRGDGAMSFTWVDSKIFSGMYKLVAMLPKPDEEAGANNEYNLPRSADSKDHDGHEGSA
jgi:hypothetical protein